ncbi:MAG: HEAT repeat domain-containing protein [Candidatus Latescibacterota bacterium]
MSIILALVFAGCSPSTENLIKKLKSESSLARTRAATELMGRRGDPETTKILVSQLNSSDSRTVFLIAQILGTMADTTAIKPLGDAAKNPNPYIRAAALWSIGSIGNKSGLPYLVEGLKDSMAVVRHSAVMGIGFLKYPPSALYLYPMLRDAVDSVRTATVQSIYNYRKIPGSGVMASDIAIALNDVNPTVRYVAVQALGGGGLGQGFQDSTVAGDLLIDALKDDNKYVRLETIVSLKYLRLKKAVPYLKEMFDTATLDEEYEITAAIKEITGEQFPPESGK